MEKRCDHETLHAERGECGGRGVAELDGRREQVHGIPETRVTDDAVSSAIAAIATPPAMPPRTPAVYG